jgi:hypothetical protein
MKIFITAIILLFGLFQSFGQSLTDNDFNSLIPSLQKEDWKTAFTLSSKLLKSNKDDTSGYHAKILYINIFSAAGMVAAGDMSYGTLTKSIMKYQGQKVIMAYHPVSDNIPLSATSLTVNDSVNQAFTSASNLSGTSIFCFETFELKDKINISDFPENSLVQCSGTLEKIEANPNKSKIWILKLIVTNASIRKDI